MRRAVPTLLALAAAAATAGEAPPVTALGAGDVELLDQRAWVESVSRRRQDVASAPAPVEIILVEDLLLSPASSVPDRLRYVPGVDVYQLRHGQYEVGLRGYNDGPFNKRLIVLQDGWQFRQPEVGAPIWAGSIDYSDLERIEVAKGPGSVTYGANAFGGVISLSSRPVPEEVRFTALGRAGSHGAWEGDATLAGPLGGAFYGKLSLGGTRLDDLPGVESGLPYIPGPRHDEDTEVDTAAWRAKALLGARLGGDWALEASLRTVRRDPWEVVDGNAYGPPNIAVDDDLAVLELRGPWLRLTVAERRTQSDYLNLKAQYDPAIDFTYLQFGFDDREHTARAQVDLGLGDHRLGLGGEISRYDSTSNLWVYGVRYEETGEYETVSRTSGGVFAEDQWQVAERLLLTLGLRGDLDSLTGAQGSPRLALNWTPSVNQYALLSYSRGYCQPTNLEAFEDDWFVKPNDELDAEQIQAVEAQWAFRDGGLDLGLGAFWNRSNDLIWILPLSGDEQYANFLKWASPPINGAGDVGPGPMFQYANLDNPYTVLGAEASARAPLADSGLTLWSNATWQLGRYERAVRFASPGYNGGPLGTIYEYDYTVPRDANAPPEWKANLGLDWADGGWFATVTGRYVSGRTVYDIGHTQLFRNTFVALDELDPYVCCDLAIGYRFARDAARFVRLSVMDVFDSSHLEWFQATPASLAAAYETQYIGEVGRQVSLSLGWEW